MTIATSTDVASALATMKAEEVEQVWRLLEAHDLIGESSHVSYLGLVEPNKHELLEGKAPPRRFRVMLIDMDTGEQCDVVVSPTGDRVVTNRVLDPIVDGQMPVVLLEFDLVQELVRQDERWLAAMRRRGLNEIDRLRVNPLSAQVTDDPNLAGRRVQRCFTFVQNTPDDLGWAHPVDGVVALFDIISREVIDVIDHVELPVPTEDGNYHLPEWRGIPDRPGIRPIEITQPDGPSFAIDENHVIAWAGWQMQVGFDQREGLVFHNISIEDNGVRRPIIYRASIAEMVVPYGDPSPQRWFQTFFDCGEYMLGGFANSLELGCDCLGDISYLDAVVAANDGSPRVIAQAICIHEEDWGVLWKHTDFWNGSAEVRRNRRLVVSFFVTVGNYDYGFYWYFYLDGTIELEVKATGVVFTSAHPGGDYPFASEVAPGLGAPHHQHLFSARLDMMVDGHVNAVDELEAASVPPGPVAPKGMAMVQRSTRLRTESDAQRLADNTKNRVWLISNPTSQNRFGRDVAYVLMPEGLPTLLANPEADIHRRATFATKHLWVTPYAPDERYPAGDFVNQHSGGAGLPQWVAADRPVDGADLVVWHTFGMTHFPRPEDWPVMPVDSTGFRLKPYGFFDRNPTLDVPPTKNDHCDPHMGHD